MSERSVSLAIDGMSCGGCVASVTKVLAKVPGVRVVGVQVGSATVALDERAAEADVVRAIEAAGFSVRAGGDRGHGDAP